MTWTQVEGVVRGRRSACYTCKGKKQTANLQHTHKNGSDLIKIMEIIKVVYCVERYKRESYRSVDSMSV